MEVLALVPTSAELISACVSVFVILWLWCCGCFMFFDCWLSALPPHACSHCPLPSHANRPIVIVVVIVIVVIVIVVIDIVIVIVVIDIAACQQTH